MKMLNGFADQLNATQSRPDAAVPLHHGETWHFTTSQFRRTLAWHIADQPSGTVAGMLQYSHVSVATFEGYVGTSQSGFRREVEAERRLAALDERTHAETVRALRASIDTLAQHVQVQTLENHALRRSAGHNATVVPLPGAGP